MRLVNSFHNGGKLIKWNIACFISLILKVENPQRIEEYMPISLVGSVYKII